MSGSMKALVLAIMLAVASPPATARGTFEAMFATDARVAGIGYRLAVGGAAAGLCDQVVPLPGFAVHGLGQYGEAGRRAVAAMFPHGARFSVLAVVPGSPADRAGLAAGQAVLAIDGRAPAADAGRTPGYAATQALEDGIAAALADGSLAVDTGAGAVRFSAERGCATRFAVDPAGGLNASADGTYVRVTTGLVDFAGGDDALALILAHEMAHNILRHRERLAAGGRGPARVRATEEEADRLALYLMARAGFDYRQAPAFWDRYVARTGAGIFSDRTHPGRRARVQAAAREVAIIDAQVAAGRAPVPGGGQTTASQGDFSR